MAGATVTGTLAQISVVPDSGGSPVGTWAKVVVNDQVTKKQETFILWSESVNQFTPPSQWIARISSLSLLRDAFVNKLPVTITTTTATSSIISVVQV